MDDQVKRPLSVWLTQALFLIVILQFTIVLLLMLLVCLPKGCWSLLRTPYLIESSGQVLLMGAAFWGLQNRKQYGKWLGAISLVYGMWVSTTGSHYFQQFYSAIFEGQSLPVPPNNCWEGRVGSVDQTSCSYSNYLDLVLRGVSALFPELLLGFLTLRLIFGRAVKRFLKQG